MNPLSQLGDLQLAILRVLWDRGESTAVDVHAALLAERGLAPTTISTMLVKMEARDLVKHRAEGRRFIYQACVSEDQVRRSMVGDLRTRLFQGDAAALVSHLISAHEIDADELGRLRALIDSAEHSGEPGPAPGVPRRKEV